MKFYIPTIDDKDAESFLENTIIKFVESQGYRIIKNKKIRSITFRHNGEIITDTVGKASVSNDEVVYAIIETDNLYLVCTTYRGVLGGEPLLTNKQYVTDIVHFDNEDTDVYKYGDWAYKLVGGNHHVDHLSVIPTSIYKYYNLNSRSIDAIVNKYLFCSHPYHLNDSMDCSTLLWDFSTLTESLFLNFYKQYDLLDKYDVDYEKDKKNNFAQIKELFFHLITNHAGIISLTTEPLHTLMWAHYSSEKGFMIEIDFEILKNNLKKENPKLNNYVFFPIQYVDNLESINFFDQNFRSADVPFLYSLGIKRKDWMYENEWRLVSYSNNYGIPSSIISPYPNIIGDQERKIFYPKEAIKSITLGKHFFHGGNVEELFEPMTFKMKKVEELKLLDFIIENFSDKIYLCGEYESNKSFKRSSERVYIIKKEDNIFTVIRTNEGLIT